MSYKMRKYIIGLTLLVLSSIVEAEPMLSYATSSQEDDSTSPPDSATHAPSACEGEAAASALTGALQRHERKAAKAWRRMQLRLEGVEEAIRGVQHSLEEHQWAPSRGRERAATAVGRVSLEQLDQRITQLEATVRRALERLSGLDVPPAELSPPEEYHPTSSAPTSSTPTSSTPTSSTPTSSTPTYSTPTSSTPTSSTPTSSTTSTPHSASESPQLASTPTPHSESNSFVSYSCSSALPPSTRDLAEAADEDERSRQCVEQLKKEVWALLLRPPESFVSPLGERLCDDLRERRVTLNGIRHLLDSGVDVNYFTELGLTPLICACKIRFGKDLNPNIISLLLERGADVNAVDGFNLQTALHHAAARDESGRVVQLLVDAGADPNARNEDGATPLHCASYFRKVASVRALVAAGAKKNLRPWSGTWERKTPYEVDIYHLSRDILRP